MQAFIDILLQMVKRDFISQLEFTELNQKLISDKAYLKWVEKNQLHPIFTQGFRQLDFNWRDVKEYLFDKRKVSKSFISDIERLLAIKFTNNYITAELLDDLIIVDELYHHALPYLRDDQKEAFSLFLSQYAYPVNLVAKTTIMGDDVLFNDPTHLTTTSRYNISQINRNLILIAYLFIRVYHQCFDKHIEQYEAHRRLTEEQLADSDKPSVDLPNGVVLYYFLSELMQNILTQDDGLIDSLIDNPIQGLWIRNGTVKGTYSKIVTLNAYEYPDANKSLVTVMEKTLNQSQSYVRDTIKVLEQCSNGLHHLFNTDGKFNIMNGLKAAADKARIDNDIHAFIRPHKEDEIYRYYPFYSPMHLSLTHEEFIDKSIKLMADDEVDDFLEDKAKKINPNLRTAIEMNIDEFLLVSLEKGPITEFNERRRFTKLIELTSRLFYRKLRYLKECNEEVDESLLNDTLTLRELGLTLIDQPDNDGLSQFKTLFNQIFDIVINRYPKLFKTEEDKKEEYDAIGSKELKDGVKKILKDVEKELRKRDLLSMLEEEFLDIIKWVEETIPNEELPREKTQMLLTQLSEMMADKLGVHVNAHLVESLVSDDFDPSNLSREEIVKCSFIAYAEQAETILDELKKEGVFNTEDKAKRFAAHHLSDVKNDIIKLVLSLFDKGMDIDDIITKVNTHILMVLTHVAVLTSEDHPALKALMQSLDDINRLISISENRDEEEEVKNEADPLTKEDIKTSVQLEYFIDFLHLKVREYRDKIERSQYITATNAIAKLRDISNNFTDLNKKDKSPDIESLSEVINSSIDTIIDIFKDIDINLLEEFNNVVSTIPTLAKDHTAKSNTKSSPINHEDKDDFDLANWSPDKKNVN